MKEIITGVKLVPVWNDHERERVEANVCPKDGQPNTCIADSHGCIYYDGLHAWGGVLYCICLHDCLTITEEE